MAQLDRPMLVCVYMRGAADGLSLVPPHADDSYYSLRPTLAIARPDDARAAKKDRALDLDGHFGLHPALSGLLPLYRNKELAIVHAVGSDDQTRSHFEAQDRMEHGGPKDDPLGSGWLARYLGSRSGAHTQSLTAVALGTAIPESLRGVPASVLRLASDVRLGPDHDEALIKALYGLYASSDANELPFDRDLRSAGGEALATLERLRALEADPPRAARYPEGALGDGLKEIARLARANLGVEVACIDAEGWDTHFVQSQVLPDLAEKLGDGLAAFREDLGEAMNDVVVVCMTEFGRRAHENTSLGTDHGRGGVMFVLGGGARGGRVITDWPGLTNERLEPPGDLAVTIDYREIVSEILGNRFGDRSPDVFPGFPPGEAGKWGLFG